jgi:hypothetical protein
MLLPGSYSNDARFRPAPPTGVPVYLSVQKAADALAERWVLDLLASSQPETENYVRRYGSSLGKLPADGGGDET